MSAPHWAADMAPVPESVSRSTSTSSAWRRKTFRPAASRAASRSSRRVNLSASTDLMRNGSMMVRNGIADPLLAGDFAAAEAAVHVQGVGHDPERVGRAHEVLDDDLLVL